MSLIKTCLCSWLYGSLWTTPYYECNFIKIFTSFCTPADDMKKELIVKCLHSSKVSISKPETFCVYVTFEKFHDCYIISLSCFINAFSFLFHLPRPASTSYVLECQNVEILLTYLFENISPVFKMFWYGVLLKREMHLLLWSLLRCSEMLSQMITFNYFSWHLS